MTPAAAPAGTAADRRTAEALQATLAELIELAAQGKQAHWTVVGPQFRSVHLHLGNDHVKWPHCDHQNWPHPRPLN